MEAELTVFVLCLLLFLLVFLSLHFDFASARGLITDWLCPALDLAFTLWLAALVGPCLTLGLRFGFSLLFLLRLLGHDLVIDLFHPFCVGLDSG